MSNVPISPEQRRYPRRTFSNCPKCGERDPSVWWHDVHSAYLGKAVAACDTIPPLGEHFLLSCRRCEFGWVEP